MKSIRNIKFFIFLFLLIGVYFVESERVSATELTREDYTLQCIFADGGLYTYSYNSAADNGGPEERKSNYKINRMFYNLRGADENDSSAPGSMFFVNSLAEINIFASNILKCRNYVNVANYIEPTETEDAVGSKTAYYVFGRDFIVADFSYRFWYMGGTLSEAIALDKAINEAKKYKLVSESYVLSADAPLPNASIYYVQRAKQASGSDKYVQVLVYDNMVLLKSDAQTTYLDRGQDAFKGITSDDKGNITSGTPPETIAINNPEPMTDMIGNSKVSYYFKPGNIRYSLGGSNVYERTNYIIDEKGQDDDELCKTIMPETALVLRDVIKYVQLLVPALLIVLVGIDVGKIVVSGNIDEEMPKQKKKIIVRFIVAVVVFFLPLIVNIILNLAIDSGEENSSTIKLIHCLFE